MCRFSHLRSVVPFALSAVLAFTGAQAQGVEQPRQLCDRSARRAPCKKFRVFEAGIYEPVLGTRYRENAFAPLELRMQTHASLEFGYMMNRRTTAEGLLATVGMAQAGMRVGVLGRERLWLGGSGTLDLSFGVIGTRIGGEDAGGTAFGGTADVALGWRDYGQLVIRGEQVRNSDLSARSIAAGLRLGSDPAIISTTLFAVTLAVVIVGFALHGGPSD